MRQVLKRTFIELGDWWYNVGDYWFGHPTGYRWALGRAQKKIVSAIVFPLLSTLLGVLQILESLFVLTTYPVSKFIYQVFFRHQSMR